MEVCPGEEQAGDESLGIRDEEKARMKVTLPLAVAPIAQEDGCMRWNSNDDGIVELGRFC